MKITLKNYDIWFEPKRIRIHAGGCSEGCARGDAATMSRSVARRAVERILAGNAKSLLGFRVSYDRRAIQIGCERITRSKLRAIKKLLDKK